MKTMDKQYLIDETTCVPFKNSLFLFKKEKRCLSINDKKSVNFRRDSLVERKSSSEIPWIQYALYLHVLVLYILLFSVYNELKRTKETMYDFHMNMLNISIKGLEVEKNCLAEISNFRNSLQLNHVSRSKRDVPPRVTHVGFDIENEDMDSEISEENVPRLRKARKAEKSGRGKGKKRNRAHRRRNHSKHAYGFPRAAHFMGALPEPIIRDGAVFLPSSCTKAKFGSDARCTNHSGLLAPWLVDKEAIKDFHLDAKLPIRGREAIEVLESGLYFIYSQVYYMSSKDPSKAHSSFFIMLKRGGGSDERMLAQCATLGDARMGGEASCFTGTAQTLLTGDMVYIKQRERDRHVLMKRGQTFLGLVLLNKRPNNKTNLHSEALPGFQQTLSPSG